MKVKDEKYTASRSWFLLPIFLGIIGGIIGLVALWRDDRESAYQVFIVGIIASALTAMAIFITASVIVAMG